MRSERSNAGRQRLPRHERSEVPGHGSTLLILFPSLRSGNERGSALTGYATLRYLERLFADLHTEMTDQHSTGLRITRKTDWASFLRGFCHGVNLSLDARCGFREATQTRTRQAPRPDHPLASSLCAWPRSPVWSAISCSTLDPFRSAPVALRLPCW